MNMKQWHIRNEAITEIANTVNLDNDLELTFEQVFRKYAPANVQSDYDNSIPKCASCGKTENLTPGYAVNKISYCPRCKRDEEQR